MSVPTPIGANNGAKLGAARRNKNDEFYTQREDVDQELRHYVAHFKGKTVLCNCDDPSWSAFWQVLVEQFEFYGLTKLISTHYANGEPSYKQEYFGRDKEVLTTPLEGDGDFRSAECVAILQEADIVVTNPPFSLFREYIAQLIEHGKQFLIIGNNNAITYKDVFALIRDNKVWLGTSANKTMEFRLADSYEKWSRVDEQGHKYGNVPAVSWFTNLSHFKRVEKLEPFRSFAEEPERYPQYDKYDAIEVSKVQDIPKDFAGAMGVPITFLGRYNPAQFEILDANVFRRSATTPFKSHGLIKDSDGTINGKAVYVRIVIRHVTPTQGA